MGTLRVNGIDLQLDNDGFLLEPELWDEAVAIELARSDGTGCLTESHWAVITYIREFWNDSDMNPTVRIVCQECGLSLKELYALFPKGPTRGAFRIAGLPKPDGCA
jgi:tRNA 2-thiouridine synthesizing protein E